VVPITFIREITCKMHHTEVAVAQTTVTITIMISAATEVATIVVEVLKSYTMAAVAVLATMILTVLIDCHQEEVDSVMRTRHAHKEAIKTMKISTSQLVQHTTNQVKLFLEGGAEV